MKKFLATLLASFLSLCAQEAAAETASELINKKVNQEAIFNGVQFTSNKNQENKNIKNQKMTESEVINQLEKTKKIIINVVPPDIRTIVMLTEEDIKKSDASYLIIEPNKIKQLTSIFKISGLKYSENIENYDPRLRLEFILDSNTSIVFFLQIPRTKDVRNTFYGYYYSNSENRKMQIVINKAFAESIYKYILSSNDSIEYSKITDNSIMSSWITFLKNYFN
ncbi:MAG: hypothetical protein QM533_07405 [Cytophagales bacterium]|nr:hypothetical protein [Cytophagales bacterium]